MSEIKEICRGRWVEILSALGMQDQFLNKKKNGPCPSCGGKTRFRFTDRGGNGTWACTQCPGNGGDGIKLVMEWKGVYFTEACRLIRSVVGGESSPVSKAIRDKIEEKKRLYMEIEHLWKRGRSIKNDDPAGLYLTNRTGITAYPSSLRLVEGLECWNAGELVGSFPCLIAYVTDVRGKFVNLHRTYLTSDGTKAQVAEPRRLMPGKLPEGSAVKLFPTQNSTVLVAEGIETAISAGLIYGKPAWALLNAHMLKTWVPPSGIRQIIVASDNDTNYTGQAAAYALANRLVCQYHVPIVEVRLPSNCGEDFNDVWRNGLRNRTWIDDREMAPPGAN